MSQEPCPACSGKAIVDGKGCSFCSGTGKAPIYITQPDGSAYPTMGSSRGIAVTIQDFDTMKVDEFGNHYRYVGLVATVGVDGQMLRAQVCYKHGDELIALREINRYIETAIETHLKGLKNE